MARRLESPNAGGGTTDHSEEIAALRAHADENELNWGHEPAHMADVRARRVAADLLETHDATGISLDNWPAARALVESFTGEPILENGV